MSLEPTEPMRNTTPGPLWHTIVVPPNALAHKCRNDLTFFARPPAGWEHSHTPHVALEERGARLLKGAYFTTRGYDLIASIGDVRCDVAAHPAFRHATLRLHNGEQRC